MHYSFKVIFLTEWTVNSVQLFTLHFHVQGLWIWNLRDVGALVTSLQKTCNKVPKEVQVLLWQGFLQLLEIDNKKENRV